jgi:hypothetical protein
MLADKLVKGVYLALALASVLLGLPLDAQAAEPDSSVEFTLGEIAPISLTSEEHLSTTRNGVKFDVFFDQGRKTSVAIYAINTGRKQLVLTPDKHRAILEDLLRRKFTVIVADFRD